VAISTDDELLLSILLRKLCIGGKYINPTTLRKISGLSKTQFKKSLKSLHNEGLIIIHHKPNGDIPSINPGKLKEIYSILDID